MSERRKRLFQEREVRAIPRWFASHKIALLLVILMAGILLLPAWGGGGMHGGGGGWSWWTWPPGGNTPYIEILAVEENTTVTIEGHRFPLGTELELTMGLMWTRGIDGYVVDTFTVPEDPFTKTFSIPAELADEYRISIRVESDDLYPYYAYNWFFNNTTTASP